ncbi:transketolase [bacterium]|nr:MAG: transketolase [bacterium]
MTLERSELAGKAGWCRRETIKLHRRCPETRLASSLSCVELLTVLFYGGFLRFDPQKPQWEGRDRFIVSKGHGSISLYPILADLGFFPSRELELIGSEEGILKVIPDTTIPGYETINGSLGHGLGVACGMARGLLEKGSARKVFVLLGDGELNEGSVWEAIMFAVQHNLHNLVLVLDNNGGSMLDFCRNILDLAPVGEKLQTFGWEAVTVDGHDTGALALAFEKCAGSATAAPKAIIANTVKGKGVPMLEKDPLSHVRMLTAEQVDEALEELC